MLNYRIIQAPTENTLNLLKRKMNTESRKLLELESYYGAVAIIQSSIPNLFYYADVASKEADVITIEITGNCPQSLSNMSIWGNIEAVQSAMNAVIKHYNNKKEKYGLSI